MTEAEIAAVLQSRLAVPVKIAIKRRQGHLHVLLGRSAEIQLDYPRLSDQVQAELKALALSGLERVTVYGRELGRTEYEWEQTKPLLNPALADTTVVLTEKSDPLLEELTVVAPDQVNLQNNPRQEPVQSTNTGFHFSSRFSWIWLAGVVLAAGIGLVFLILVFL
ncbi:MAG: hypothetical protein ACUVRV_01190 [Cyanobacteriota bacterium]